MWNFHDVNTAGDMRIGKTWEKACLFFFLERNETVGEELSKCLLYYL